MPFDALMTEIGNVHGMTQFMGNQQGKAVNVRVGTSTFRASSYRIYSNAAYGSRNSNAPPADAGAYMWRMQLDILDAEGAPVNVQFNGGIHLAKVRTPPAGNVTYKEIKDRTGRQTIIQVTDKALYLLFDIEQAQEPERLLKMIYEKYVLEITDDRHRTAMKAFRTGATPAADPETTRTTTGGFHRRARPTATPTPPPVEDGKGVTWDHYRRRHEMPSIPAESRPEEIITALALARTDGMRRQLTDTESRYKEAERQYERKLRELALAREAWNKEQDMLSTIRLAISTNNTQPDEMTLTILKGVLESHYEKVWKHGENFWALTAPITIQYAPGRNGEQDPCKVLAGKFLVRVSKSAEVRFFREDGRTVKEPPRPGNTMQGGRGWAISPHNTLEWNEEGSICWGTQSTMMQEAQRNADYAQIFLLTAQHMAYVNPDESYVSLRGYAQLLNLPMIEDPLVTSFEELARLEEEKRQKEQEEKNRQEAEDKRKAIQEEIRRKATRIEEVGELSAEEMAAMGLNADGTPPGMMDGLAEYAEVHRDHMTDELNADFNDLEGR